MSLQMNKLFDQIHKIPQVPELVRTIINQLSDPKADMLDIAKNVDKEQVIAMKVLRLVNSAHFGLSKKISSIDEATILLGMNQLKTLVIASGIVGAIPTIENFDIKKFWSESFLTATYAKQLAKDAKIDAEVAYTAGLISNLGNILLHMVYPAEANEIDQHAKGNTPRSELERRRLGFTSQEACAELCRRWKFSDELVDTIAQCAEPLASAEPSKLACAVHIARYLSECRQIEKSDEEIMGSFPFQAAAQINLIEQAVAEKLSQILTLESKLNGLLE